MKKNQMKLPVILTATIMGHISLSWAWNQITFLLTYPIYCYDVRGYGHAHATVHVWQECYKMGPGPTKRLSRPSGLLSGGMT